MTAANVMTRVENMPDEAVFAEIRRQWRADLERLADGQPITEAFRPLGQEVYQKLSELERRENCRKGALRRWRRRRKGQSSGSDT